jgi:hypothetical protein
VAREARDIMLDELIDELARVYWEDWRAQVLVRRAGFPAQELPRFTTPRVFWSLVIWGAAGSEIPDGPEVLEAIVRGVLEEYPSNEMFRAWGRKPEGWDLGTRRGVLARFRKEIIDFSAERNRHKHSKVEPTSDATTGSGVRLGPWPRISSDATCSPCSRANDSATPMDACLRSRWSRSIVSRN